MNADIKINYQKLLDKILEDIKNTEIHPSLLIHACCAPCSSYVTEYLLDYFNITLLYYNPNIFPAEEYDFRANELRRLVAEMKNIKNVKTVIESYDPRDFDGISRGLEELPEGGERCHKCYRLRLEHAAQYARSHNYDYFCTTLSISPHKNSTVLNRIGFELAESYGVSYLPSDFKKRNGYRRSCELSEQYNLYRQDYCGCRFSALEAEKRRSTRNI